MQNIKTQGRQLKIKTSLFLNAFITQEQKPGQAFGSKIKLPLRMRASGTGFLVPVPLSNPASCYCRPWEATSKGSNTWVSLTCLGGLDWVPQPLLLWASGEHTSTGGVYLSLPLPVPPSLFLSLLFSNNKERLTCIKYTVADSTESLLRSQGLRGELVLVANTRYQHLEDTVTHLEVPGSHGLVHGLQWLTNVGTKSPASCLKWRQLWCNLHSIWDP